MKINPYIFRGYDIRGVVGKDLDYSVMKKIARAYATMLGKRRIKEAVVGRDCRTSGEEFQKAVMEGLTESGIKVIDIGMCLTSTMYFAQYFYQSNGGVMITASHNPAEYNGVKMALGYSHTLDSEEIQELKKIIDKGEFVESKQKAEIVEVVEKTKDAYFNDLLKRTNLTKKFKVVVDASYGTAGPFAPELLKRAGYEVVCNNCEVDGTFPLGVPDPTETKILKRLGESVVKEKADLGIAFDGDGDRLGIVDEKGRIIWADVLVAIFADDVLDFMPGSKVVFNVLCSKLVNETIEKKGKPVLWKVGHGFIKDKIMSEKAAFGGELSGHFFFVDNFYGHDDALFAALRLFEYLERKGKPFSEIIDSFPGYISSPEIKLGCPDEVKVELIDKKINADVKKEFNEAVFTEIDGIRADFPDGMLVIRYSQNGPYITIKFESKDEKGYQQKKEKIRNILKKYSEINWREGVNEESLL